MSLLQLLLLHPISDISMHGIEEITKNSSLTHKFYVAVGNSHNIFCDSAKEKEVLLHIMVVIRYSIRLLL